MPFTPVKIGKAKELVERMHRKMQDLKKGSETAIGYGVQAAETVGTAFAFGYAHARWGGDDKELKVIGVPADLAVGITLVVAGLGGGLGKYGEHGVNIGSGALSSYAYKAGTEIGARAAKNATTQNTGYFPQSVIEPPIMTSGQSYDDGYMPQGYAYPYAASEEPVAR